MSALTTALNSIQADQEKERQKTKDAISLVMRAVVNESRGASDDSDVKAIRAALKSNLFTTSQIQELIDVAGKFTEAVDAQREIATAQETAVQAAEHFRLLCEQNRQGENTAGQSARDSRGLVGELQEKISRLPKLKKSHPELYAEWSAGLGEDALQESTEENQIDEPPA